MMHDNGALGNKRRRERDMSRGAIIAYVHDCINPRGTRDSSDLVTFRPPLCLCRAFEYQGSDSLSFSRLRRFFPIREPPIASVSPRFVRFSTNSPISEKREITFVISQRDRSFTSPYVRTTQQEMRLFFAQDTSPSPRLESFYQFY